MELIEVERKSRVLTKAQFGCLRDAYTLNVTNMSSTLPDSRIAHSLLVISVLILDSSGKAPYCVFSSETHNHCVLSMLHKPSP